MPAEDSIRVSKMVLINFFDDEYLNVDLLRRFYMASILVTHGHENSILLGFFQLSFK